MPTSSSSSLTPRQAALREISARVAAEASANGAAVALNNGAGPYQTSKYFGVNTFGARQMRDKLPKDVYDRLAAAIRLGRKLDADVAPTVAQAIKEWAVSRGVTHFTHWFQPQTGLTAEKHDAFLNFDDDRQPLESFTG